MVKMRVGKGLRGVLYGFLLLSVFMMIHGGVEGSYYTYGSTSIKPCPVNESILFDTGATENDLVNWNGMDGNYGGYLCPSPIILNCPYGIAWRNGQCTYNENLPIQYVDFSCVKNVRLYKLSLLVKQGVCKKPKIWQKEEVTESYINTGAAEHIEEVEKVGDKEVLLEKLKAKSEVKKIKAKNVKYKDCDTDNASCATEKDLKAIQEQAKGDPIDLSNGAFKYHNTLISLSQKGGSFEFTLYYQNQSEYDGVVGYNWDHNWNQFLNISGDTILYHDGKMKVYTFAKKGNIWENNNNLKIIQEGEHYLLENTKTREKYHFAEQNSDVDNLRLVEYEVNNTNYQLIYGELGYLKSIDLPDGETVYFEYKKEGDLGQQVLERVIAPHGKSVAIGYYDNYEEKGLDFDIETLLVKNKGEERELKFEYDTHVEYLYDNEGNIKDVIVDDVLSHNISKLIDSKGQIYVENAYNDKDRVVEQKYGEDTLTLSYEGDSSLTKTEVSNRKGEKTIYIYDEHSNLIQVKDKVSGKTFTSVYNKQGLPVKVELSGGREKQYTYDEKGNLLEYVEYKKETTGLIVVRKHNYQYNENNQVIQIKDKKGNISNFEYDGNGNSIASEIINREGKKLTRRYQYDSHNQLTQEISPEGISTTYSYDESGNIVRLTISGTQGEEKVFVMKYDEHGNMIELKDPRGNSIKYHYNGWNLLTQKETAEGVVQNNSRDANNNLTKIETLLANGKKAKIEYSYNMLDKLIQIDAQQNTTQTSIIKNTYDPNDHLETSQLGNQAKRKYQYDSLQRIVSKSTILVTAEGTQTIAYSYEYDDNGNIITSIDPKQRKTLYEYDSKNHLVKVISPRKNYDDYEYDDYGNIVSKKTYDKTDKLLAEYHYTYNARNQLMKTEQVDILNNRQSFVLIRYDKYGKILEKQYTNDGKEKYSYDGLNRLKTSIDVLGNTTTYYYDKNNNIIQKILQARTSGYAEQGTYYTYDKDNRLVKIENHLGQITQYHYNTLNQVTEIIDAKGNSTYYEYDYHGNITKKVQHDGSQEIVTQYEYDEADQLVKQTDAKGNITQYTYDGIGRIISIVYPDNKSVRYSYDEVNNVVKIKDANGNSITNIYNESDWLTRREIDRAQETKGVTLEEYLYDDLGRMTKIDNDEHSTAIFSYDMLGNTTQERNNGQTIYYGYDSYNQLHTITYPSKSKLYQYYDLAGRVTKLSFADADVLDSVYDSFHKKEDILGNKTRTKYEYDNGGRLQTMKHYNFKSPAFNQLNKEISYHYTYDQLNNITDTSTQKYHYDSLSQLKKAEYKINKIDQRDKTALTTSYSYDKLGNRTQDSDEAFAASVNHGFHQTRMGYSSTWGNYYGHGSSFRNKYEYGKGGIGSKGYFNNTEAKYTTNSRNQYTKVHANMSGSIINQSACWFGHPNCEEAIDRAHTFEYSYDANGNMTADNKRRYSYDYRNRLVEANLRQVDLEENGQVYKITYRYDNLNRRAEKRVYKTGPQLDMTTTRYMYAGQMMIREEVSYTLHPTRNYEKEFVYTPGSIDGLVFSTLTKMGWTVLQNIQKFYYHHDHQGSVVAISDEKRNVVQNYTYDARGNVIASEMNHWYDLKLPRNKAGIQNTKLYNGKEYEPELGLYYYRNRYYSPTLGKFISQDPLLYIDGPNPYTYVNNNPVNFVDPWGLEKTLIFWGEEYLSHENWRRFTSWEVREYGKKVFKHKAEAYKKYLIQEGAKESNIKIIDGRYINNRNKALSTYKNINNITYYGHGSSDAIFLRDMTPDDISDNDNLLSIVLNRYADAYPKLIQTYNNGEKDIKFSELDFSNTNNVKVQFFSCHSSQIVSDIMEFTNGEEGIGYNSTVKYRSLETVGNIQFLPTGVKEVFDAIGNKK